MLGRFNPNPPAIPSLEQRGHTSVRVFRNLMISLFTTILLSQACLGNPAPVEKTRKDALSREDFALSGITLGQAWGQTLDGLGKPLKVEKAGSGDLWDEFYHYPMLVIAPLKDPDIVAYISTNKPGVPTPRGLQVGDDIVQVFKLYPTPDSSHGSLICQYFTFGLYDPMLVISMRDGKVHSIAVYYVDTSI